MHAGVTRITIDVDLSANPIEGTLRSGDGVVREFTGYMQLITAFEDVVDTARHGLDTVVVEGGADSWRAE